MHRKRHLIDFAPLVVLFILVCMSIEVYFYSEKNLQTEIRSSFVITADDMSKSVVLRMRSYEQVLLGGDAIVDANGNNITREIWQRYTKDLRLEEQYPGMQAISLVSKISADKIKEHEAIVRANGLKNYKIHPVTKKDTYIVVDYIYPESVANMRAIGFDLSSEPTRAAMLSTAARIGSTAISDKIWLKQDVTKAPPVSILMGMPIFRDNKLLGYVTAPFRMNEIMSGIFGSHVKSISLKIYDSTVSDKNLLYSSSDGSLKEDRYHLEKKIDMYGRKWVMVFDATPYFLSEFDDNLPITLLLGGIITGTLLSVLIFIILRTRTRAYEIAEHMTQKLSESENRYRKTYEQAPTGMLMTALDLKILRTNNKFCSISGYDAKELAQMSVLSLLGQSQMPDISVNIEKLIARQMDVCETERRIITKTGDSVWADITVSVYFDKHYSPLYLIFIIEDISRRKRAEEAIIALSMRQTAILDNSLVGIMQIKNRAIEWCNSAMETLSGYSMSELIGADTRIIFKSDEEYEDFGRTIADGGKMDENGLLRSQLHIRKKDGTLAWVNIAGKRLLNEPGQSAIWVLSDITEQKKAEKELMRLNSTLESKVVEETQKRLEQERLFMQQGRLAAMGEMIGAIAHQWRQPLNIIALMVQNIYDDFEDKTLTVESMHQFMNQTLQQIEYMSVTIDDFRNFFKKDTHVEEFSPAVQIESVIKLAEQQLLNNNIQLRFETKCDSKLTGLPNEFAHVVLNLVNNSKDAIMQNNIEYPYINIKMYKTDERLFIAVSDNAGGIPDDIRDRIFDPYFTTKGPDKGTGIGLYMSKLIIDDHFGGKLSFRNTGSGAEFVMEIPLHYS